MNPLVTNRWIALNRERIFSHTPAYNAETPVAGRADAMSQVVRLVDGSAGTHHATVAEPLGAGKTFLVQHAIGELARRRKLKEEKETAYLLSDELAQPTKGRRARAKVAIVDELDRRRGIEVLAQAVETAARWLADGCAVIFVGDFSLLNEELSAPLQPFGGTNRVNLEPLTGPLLLDAVRLRVEKWLYQELANDGKSPRTAQRIAAGRASEAAVRMIDPGLMTWLVPPTSPQVATFRDTLGLLQEMAQFLPYDDAECRFSIDTFAAWNRSAPRMPESKAERIEFKQHLNAWIRAQATAGAAIQPLALTEWPWMSGLGDVAADRARCDIVEPLVRAQVLTSMGIPHAPPTRSRLPGPYLPTILTFMRAVLGNE